MSGELPSRRQEIEELYRRFGQLVLSRCRYLLRETAAAEDASQEVFVKVLQSISGFRQEASPSTWILRITTNHCLNLIAARRARWHERYEAYARQVGEQATAAGVDPERARAVHRLLSKLDTETAQVAVHYYVDEMTQEEIAEALDRSLPTVRKRLAKFKRVAQKELGREP